MHAFKNDTQYTTSVNTNLKKNGFNKIQTCGYPQLYVFKCGLQSITGVRPSLKPKESENIYFANFHLHNKQGRMAQLVACRLAVHEIRVQTPPGAN